MPCLPRRPARSVLLSASLLALGGIVAGCGGAEDADSAHPPAAAATSVAGASADATDCARLAAVDPGVQIEWEDTGFNSTTSVIDASGSAGRFEVDVTAADCQNAGAQVDRLIVQTLHTYLRGRASVCQERLKDLDPDTPLLAELRSTGPRGADLLLGLAPNIQSSLGLIPERLTAPATAELTAALKALRKGSATVGVDSVDRQLVVDEVEEDCF
jgi:hypothetical protein